MKLIKEFKKEYQVSNPYAVKKFLTEFAEEDKEYFIVLGLNSRNQVTFREIVHIGTLNTCLVHPREVFKKAIINSCESIIIAHNHPSGSLEPSEEDMQITQKLEVAGELLNIKVLDAVIITKQGLSSKKMGDWI